MSPRAAFHFHIRLGEPVYIDCESSFSIRDPQADGGLPPDAGADAASSIDVVAGARPPEFLRGMDRRTVGLPMPTSAAAQCLAHAQIEGDIARAHAAAGRGLTTDGPRRSISARHSRAARGEPCWEFITHLSRSKKVCDLGVPAPLGWWDVLRVVKRASTGTGADRRSQQFSTRRPPVGAHGGVSSFPSS